MDVLKCVERIPQDYFCLDEVYAFVGELQQKHPDNNHVYDKIRQQLQFLRDKGFIQFFGGGLNTGEFFKYGLFDHGKLNSDLIQFFSIFDHTFAAGFQISVADEAIKSR